MHLAFLLPPPGSRRPSRPLSHLRVLVATPYRKASSVHVCFCEFNSLVPRHELVEPRCFHTPPQHSAANIKTQQPKSSLPRMCGILSKTRESPSCVMGTWSMPSNREVISPAKAKCSAEQKPRLNNLLGPFHLFSRVLHREQESLGYRSALAKKTHHSLCSLPQRSNDKQLQHQSQSLHGVSLPHAGQAPWTVCVREEAVSGGSAVVNHGKTWMAILEVAATRARRLVPKPSLCAKL